MPNDDTPARRGAPPASAPGQGRSAVLTKKGDDANGISGLGALKCSDGGISPRSTASVALMSPVAPAAASRWPTLVFTEPSAQNCVRSVSPNACVSAATSTGSPRAVPLPWPST
jgi:hypothetical protein